MSSLCLSLGAEAVQNRPSSPFPVPPPNHSHSVRRRSLNDGIKDVRQRPQTTASHWPDAAAAAEMPAAVKVVAPRKPHPQIEIETLSATCTVPARHVHSLRQQQSPRSITHQPYTTLTVGHFLWLSPLLYRVLYGTQVRKWH